MDTSEKSVIKGKHIAITGSLLFYRVKVPVTIKNP